MSTKREKKRNSMYTSEGDSLLSSFYSSDEQRNTICSCGFIKDNKKPLVAIIIIILLGFSATITMLYLDHEGYWDTQYVNKLWFNQTLVNSSTGLYPLWLRHANPFGIPNSSNQTHLHLYRSQYGSTWTQYPMTYNYSTLRTQSQLIYNFATGFNYTNNISYLYAMDHGVNVLLYRFRDTNHGGFYYSINETTHATVIDDTKDSIGHSLVIYALSTACRVTKNNTRQLQSYIQILNATYSIFIKHFMDEYGGIYSNLSSDWRVLPYNKSQLLPLLYHFEALSQLWQVADMDSLDWIRTRIEDDIIGIYGFVCGKLLQRYKYKDQWYWILFDEYSVDWKTPSGNASLGNAFKWAYLIAYFMDNNVIPTADNSTQLLNYALDLGYGNGKIYNWIDRPKDDENNTPFWVCCNAIKTLYYYYLQEHKKWQDTLQNMILYYQQYYYDNDPNIGGIFYSPTQHWKGNVSKVDYECVDMTLFIMQY